MGAFPNSHCFKRRRYEKVTVFEALHDLDFIGNDEEATEYAEVDIEARFNGSSKRMLSLLRKRTISGKIEEIAGITYSEWSRKGRLNGRFFNIKPPIYVRNSEEYKEIEFLQPRQLQNHRTSNQNADVIKRHFYECPPRLCMPKIPFDAKCK